MNQFIHLLLELFSGVSGVTVDTRFLLVGSNIKVHQCLPLKPQTHMDKLVLGVVLLAAALPVAVGLIYGLGFLLALVFIQILTQVQDPPPMVLEKAEQHFL